MDIFCYFYILEYNIDYNDWAYNGTHHKKIVNMDCSFIITWFIYLFWVLRRFQHCTGHIMTGSWKGRGNQYIQFVGVLYCKLVSADQWQATTSFPTWGRAGNPTPASEVGGESVTTLPPWPLITGSPDHS